MALIQIEIVESPELLAQLIEQEINLQKFQKLRMLYLLKTQKLKTLRHIAQILGRHRSTLQLWVKHYRQGGLAALLQNKHDRCANIPEAVIDRLMEQFKDAPFLPCVSEVQSWLYQFSKFHLQILVGAYGRTPLQKIICSASFWNWYYNRNSA